MKNSIIATILLLLITVSVILLTFGIGERIAIINNSESHYELSEDNQFRRIDMYNPDSLSLSTTKPIYDYDLAVDLGDFYFKDAIMVDSDIELLNQELLLSADELNGNMPNPNILPALVFSANSSDAKADKLSEAIDTAIKNTRRREAPRVAIDLSKISVFRYEPVIINASIYTTDTVKNISIYVRYKSDKLVRKNGDDRYSINVFKIENSQYKGTYLHPFGGTL